MPDVSALDACAAPADATDGAFAEHFLLRAWGDVNWAKHAALNIGGDLYHAFAEVAHNPAFAIVELVQRAGVDVSELEAAHAGAAEALGPLLCACPDDDYRTDVTS